MQKSRNKKPIPKKYSLATKIHSGEKSPEWIFLIMEKRKSKRKKQKGKNKKVKNKKSKGLKKKNKIKN